MYLDHNFYKVWYQHSKQVWRVNMHTFVGNFLGYAATKYYWNWIIFSQVFAKVKRVTFFETQCTFGRPMQMTCHCCIKIGIGSRILTKRPFVPESGGLHRDSSIFSCSSSTLRARSTELSQNRPQVRKWVRFKNACPKFGVSLPLKIGGKTIYFWHFSTTSQLNGNFNGQYFRNETWHKQSGKALKTARGPMHHPKISWSLVHKRLATKPEF